MSEFINLVLSAFNPISQEENKAAQNELITLKNSDLNAFINLICESLQIPNLEEKAAKLLLILSREAFSVEADEQTAEEISSEIISKYESILVSEMKDSNKEIRFHSSMSFGHFACYYILRDTAFLDHMFDLFNMNENSKNFILSFENSLLYVLEQNSLSNDQNKEVANFIFSRLNLEEPSTDEQILCLQLLFQITPIFLNFLDAEEKVNFLQNLKQFTTVSELNYYCFLIWSDIMNQDSEIFIDDLFNEIMEISIQVVSFFEDESNQQQNNKNFLTKFEIFKFWDFSIYSENREILSQIHPYLPKLAEFGLKNLFIPSLDDENENIATDISTFLILSIIETFPNESIELFQTFIQSNFQNSQNKADQSISLFDYKDQYDSFILTIMFFKTDLASTFLEISIEMIQIGFNSPLDQFKILALNIVSEIIQFADSMSNQVDFISFLPICLNFMKSDVSKLQNEALLTINSIISMVYPIDKDKQDIHSKSSNYENFEIMDFIKEVTSLIQSNDSLSQIPCFLRLLDDMIEYVDDSDSLHFVFQFVCELMQHLHELNPNENSIGLSIEIISSILQKKSSATFPYEEMCQLFEFLLNLQSTENGGIAIYTIGFMAWSLKSKFEPMLNETIETSLRLIDGEIFARHSIKCIQKVILSCNSNFAIEDIVRRLFGILDDKNSSIVDYLISFQTIRVIVLMYYNAFYETDLFELIINYLNMAVQNLNEMLKEDNETALIVANLVFEIYCILIKKDLKKYYRLISSNFFVLASTIILAHNSDDDDDNVVDVLTKFIGQLVVITKFFAQNFGSSIYEMLKQSHILDFLMKILEGYKDDEQNDTKEAIEYIFSTVCSDQQ